MSTFAKKVTSAVAGLAIVFSIVSPIAGVSAAYTSVDAANKLATLGVIVDQSANPADYRLGDTLTRNEGVKVMMNLSSITVVDNCAGKFADLSASDWACKYAETALANGMVAANANFAGARLLSNIEGLKMVFQGRDLERNDNADWRAGYVDAAVEMGIANAFTNYDTPVTRGQFFIWAANAIDAEVTDETTDDLLCEILGTCDDTTDTTDPVVVEGDMLEVSLSPLTPAAATIPGDISGLAVAAFDLTAGNSDVTVSSIVVKRTGLSDKDTLTAIAAFTDEGRASKAKNDSQENDTEATLTLDNGGVVVMAGETVTVVLVADIASTSVANGDEFALEIVEVTATSPVEMADSLVANTMKVGGVDAAGVTILTDGSVSDVKVGDNDVEIFKFKVEGSNSEDVILKSITFKGEGSIDEGDEMSDYQLEFDGSVVATAMVNGKYITFDLGDGITIAEGQTEKFAVLADIDAGVNKTIAFKVDKTLDVMAEGTKYGFGASVDITAVDQADGLVAGTNDLGVLSVEAGELSLADIDAPADKIRADKKNVELGSINVTNVSGAPLELQAFAVNVTVAGSAFIDDGAGVGGVAADGVKQAGEAAATLDTVFENFEVEINGTTYELTVVNGTLLASSYSETDLNVTLPEGVTEMVIRADTKAHVSAGTTVSLAVTNIGTTGFKAVELDEETAVTDITPSSLSFKTVDFITAGAKLTATPLADVNVVRGSKDVVANQFEIKAEEASFVEVDEVKVTVAGYAPATANQVVSSVALYRGSVSVANKLSEKSGSKISAAGLVTFDGFKTKIEANQTATFLAVISIVDGADAVGKVLTVDVTSVSAEDDDGDSVVVTGTAPNNKTVTVTNSGSFTVTYDANNAANKEVKTVLAGTSAILASYDVQAQNEAVDVETVDVTFANTTNLSDAFLSARLLLDGVQVGTATNSDLVGAVLTFSDLTLLEIPTENVELEVEVTTSTIGFEKVGKVITANSISGITLKDATGVDSGKTVTLQTNVAVAKTFSVVDVIVTPTIVATLADGTAKVKLTANAGGNTQAASNATPVVTLVSLAFTDNGNAGGLYKVYEDGESAPATFQAINTAGAAASVTSISFTDEVIVNILPDGVVDTTYSLELNKNGVTYNGTLTNNMTSPLTLGTKTY